MCKPVGPIEEHSTSCKAPETFSMHLDCSGRPVHCTQITLRQDDHKTATKTARCVVRSRVLQLPSPPRTFHNCTQTRVTPTHCLTCHFSLALSHLPFCEQPGLLALTDCFASFQRCGSMSFPARSHGYDDGAERAAMSEYTE